MSNQEVIKNELDVLETPKVGVMDEELRESIETLHETQVHIEKHQISGMSDASEVDKQLEINISALKAGAGMLEDEIEYIKKSKSFTNRQYSMVGIFMRVVSETNE